MSTVGAGKANWVSYLFASDKDLGTDFTLVLPIATIIIIDVMMRSPTKRTNGFVRDSFTITTLNGFYRFRITLEIVFKEELPVLFDESFDDRELINLEFLIFGRMRIVKSPLL